MKVNNQLTINLLDRKQPEEAKILRFRTLRLSPSPLPLQNKQIQPQSSQFPAYRSYSLEVSVNSSVRNLTKK